METMLNIENGESEVARSEHLALSNDKNNKFYSLIPDLVTGWKPKNIKIPSPVIIKYRSPLVSQMLNYYQDDRDKIIYIGTISPI